MFTEGQPSPETIADYQREANRLVRQCLRETFKDEEPLLFDSPLLRTASWFLNSHERWSQNTIRRYTAALKQEVGRLGLSGEFDDTRVLGEMLWRLEHDRPRPISNVEKSKKGKQLSHQKKVATKKKTRKKYRKSLPLKELRALIEFFRRKADSFSLWIVGYIFIASRLGWRPGEIVALKRDGSFLRAEAEKCTNGRGLTDTCEINISAHIERSGLFKKQNLLSQLDKWIADASKWEAYYGGNAELRDNINSRLASACEKIGIKRVCTYTFRNFAISCMKASGFSQSEIAVIVNHATNRTASEHYGRRRFGRKRARKMLGFDPARLLLVRNTARIFRRDPDKKKKDAENKNAEVLSLTTSDNLDADAFLGSRGMIG
jgi:integrase